MWVDEEKGEVHVLSPGARGEGEGADEGDGDGEYDGVGEVGIGV